MNSARVFLTGGGGFVGGTLLRELARIDGIEVVALDRSGSLSGRPGAAPIRIVRGELLDPNSYAEALRGCDCVIHLAAATGKASPDVHMNDTAVGTEVLLRACREAGVGKFLLLSSIATTFPDKRGYPYAIAKERAERAVAASGLRYCILRPTMIFGAGSPILASLNALAMLPVVVVPGAGTVRVQPIAVGDVVRSIISILRADRFESETFEVGGPEILTMAELLHRLRARKGERGSAVRVPLGLIQAPLAVAERIGLRSLLPTTAGQLSSFQHDGVARPNPLQQEITPDLESLDSMIGAPSTTGARKDAVEAECRVFTRHLLGLDADRAVVESYRAALGSVAALTPSGRWEHALLAFARRNVVTARCADAFAAFFARSSVLRKRLVILLAILETRPPYFSRIDEALGGPGPLVMARVGWRGLVSILYLILGVVLLVPVRIALSGGGEPAR